MHERAAQLIAELALEPHPEGGFFRKVFHSVASVRPLDGRAERTGLSAIYFLLVASDASHWHRVFSDEAWHLYEGEPVEMFQIDPEFRKMKRERLGPVSDGMEPVRVVPANHWQAARTMGEYSLVGCTVGPGFEYDDFELLRDLPADAERMRRHHPQFAAFI
ncbi:MAG: cupin domain-containing protein [Halofilum sp. (in: g-proteobacteria)]